MNHSSFIDSDSEFFLPLENQARDRVHTLQANVAAMEVPSYGATRTAHQVYRPAPEPERVDRRLHAAQDRLDLLRQEQAQVQLKRAELEALQAKEDEFEAARDRLLRRFTESVTELEDMVLQAKSQALNFQTVADNFRQQLGMVESIQLEGYTHAERDVELDDALDAMAEAEFAYEEGVRKLHALFPKREGVSASRPATNPAEVRNFGYWVRCGLAFSLPLIALLSIALILVLTALEKSPH